MRVIMSAYCCCPNRGSEAAMGWNWPLQMAKRHDVWVLTRKKYRDPIERELPNVPHRDRLHFVYVDTPDALRFWKRGVYGMWLYYWLWQNLAYRQAATLHKETPFDIAHHVTLGVWRAPCHLWKLNIPLIWGPIGGGQSAPPGFTRTLGWRGGATHAVRALAQRLSLLDPTVRATRRHAHTVLATDPMTLRMLAKLPGKPPTLFHGIGTEDAVPTSTAHPNHPGPIKLLWAGRIVAWKGLPLLINALARIDPAVDWQLRVINDGPDRPRCEKLAHRLNVHHRIEFTGRLPRFEDVLSAYSDADAFVFTSLHDSSGAVALEAMAAGLPIICLDHAGPSTVTTDDCAIRIPPKSEPYVHDQIARAIETLARDPEKRTRMGQAALARANGPLTWASHGQNMDRLYRAATATQPLTPKNAIPLAHR